MTSSPPKPDPDALLEAVRAGDRGAASGLMRAIRMDEFSKREEVRCVDALYAMRERFHSRRLLFALSLLCTRTGARARGRALLLELVAGDYPPAMHVLGCDMIEAGRAEAGLQLLRLARGEGYRLGDVAFWRYQARLARGPRRAWLHGRALVAALRRRRNGASASAHGEASFWLPE